MVGLDHFDLLSDNQITMKLLIIILVFSALESSALKLDCKSTDDPTYCEIEDIPNPSNEPVEFSNMSPLVRVLTLKNCSTSKIPVNLFANYSSMQVLRVSDSSNFKQVRAGIFIFCLYLRFFNY